MYGFDGPQEQLQSGIDVAEMIITNWKENQLLSIEDPLHPEDIKALRHLKEVCLCIFSLPLSPSLSHFRPLQKIAETLETFRDEASSGGATHSLDHSYTLGGVGGEEGCCLQIVADKACLQTEDIRKYAQEAVYNAINVGLASDAIPLILHLLRSVLTKFLRS
jgi:hypothetical protein